MPPGAGTATAAARSTGKPSVASRPAERVLGDTGTIPKTDSKHNGNMDAKLVSYAVLMLFTGSINTIATKMQARLHSIVTWITCLRNVCGLSRPKFHARYNAWR